MLYFLLDIFYLEQFITLTHFLIMLYNKKSVPYNIHGIVNLLQLRGQSYSGLSIEDVNVK